MRFMKTIAKVLAATALVSAGSAATAAKIAVIGGSNDDAFWNIIKK
jgi:simple sugar transport system substrate-binding protein